MGVYKKGRHWYIDYYVKGMRKRKKSARVRGGGVGACTG